MSDDTPNHYEAYNHSLGWLGGVLVIGYSLKHYMGTKSLVRILVRMLRMIGD